MSNKIYNVQNKTSHKNHLLFSVLFILSAIILASIQASSVKEQPLKPIPIAFDSEGSKLHGFFYPANTNEPTSTVILCHGFPGNDKEPLGLGTKMMQEGINALAFNYRGTWASEGIHAPQNSLQDVNSAIDFL